MNHLVGSIKIESLIYEFDTMLSTWKCFCGSWFLFIDFTFRASLSTINNLISVLKSVNIYNLLIWMHPCKFSLINHFSSLLQIGYNIYHSFILYINEDAQNNEICKKTLINLYKIKKNVTCKERSSRFIFYCCLTSKRTAVPEKWVIKRLL